MMSSIVVLAFLPFMCYAAMMTGGLSEITMLPTNPNVVFALGAVNDYYAKQGDNAARSLVEVVKAETQVVAGAMYHLTLRVKAGDQTELCKVKVWSRSWLTAPDNTQLSGDPQCKAEAQPGFGGQSTTDLNSPDVKAALGFAMDMFNKASNNMFLSKSITVESVTKQVVAGMLYHFKGVKMATTNCQKSASNTVLDNCNVANGGIVSKCDFDISFQAWMDPQYTLMKGFNCQ